MRTWSQPGWRLFEQRVNKAQVILEVCANNRNVFYLSRQLAHDSVAHDSGDSATTAIDAVI
jgi:hypothetical protein